MIINQSLWYYGLWPSCSLPVSPSSLVCYEIGRRPQKRKTNVTDETLLLEDREMPDGREEEGMKAEESRDKSGLSCVNMAFLPDTSSTDESEPGSMHDLDADGTGHLLEPQR